MRSICSWFIGSVSGKLRFNAGSIFTSRFWRAAARAPRPRRVVPVASTMIFLTWSNYVMLSASFGSLRSIQMVFSSVY